MRHGPDTLGFIKKGLGAGRDEQRRHASALLDVVHALQAGHAQALPQLAIVLPGAPDRPVVTSLRFGSYEG